MFRFKVYSTAERGNNYQPRVVLRGGEQQTTDPFQILDEKPFVLAHVVSEGILTKGRPRSKKETYEPPCSQV